MPRLSLFILIFSLLLFTTPSVQIAAQCLGEDCSIKGRNKARKQKNAKMTGKKRSSTRVHRRSYSGGTAFDPFASNSSSKRTSKQGYDPFEAQAKRKKGKSGSGFDPFEQKSSRKMRKGRGSANDSWLADASPASVESGGFAGWDDGSHKQKIRKGGGIWANRDDKYKSPKRKTLNHSAGSNWDEVFDATTFGGGSSGDKTGDYDMRSWSDYGSAAVSHDVTYSNPHQFRFSFIYASQLKTGSTAKAYLNAVNPHPVMGGELAIEWLASGAKNYHHYFNLPVLGAAVGYLNLGANKDLGHCGYFLPYASIPVIRTRPVDLYFSAGLGAAYVSKYDKDFDACALNDAFASSASVRSGHSPLISTPLNTVVKASIGINFRPVLVVRDDQTNEWSRYTISLEGNFYHFGNLAFSQPDKGLNLLGAQLSVKYLTSDPQFLMRRNADNLPHVWFLDFSLGGGAKQLSHLDGNDHYVTAAADLYLKRQVANALRLGLGANLFFDNSFSVNHDVCDHYPYANTYDHNSLSDQFRLGACLSSELVFGRFSYLFDAGYYLINPIKRDNEKFYLRNALKYHFSPSWFSALSLKSHGFTPDLATFNIGYSFSL